MSKFCRFCLISRIRFYSCRFASSLLIWNQPVCHVPNGVYNRRLCQDSFKLCTLFKLYVLVVPIDRLLRFTLNAQRNFKVATVDWIKRTTNTFYPINNYFFLPLPLALASFSVIFWMEQCFPWCSSAFCKRWLILWLILIGWNEAAAQPFTIQYFSKELAWICSIFSLFLCVWNELIDCCQRSAKQNLSQQTKGKEIEQENGKKCETVSGNKEGN